MYKFVCISSLIFSSFFPIRFLCVRRNTKVPHGFRLFFFPSRSLFCLDVFFFSLHIDRNSTRMLPEAQQKCTQHIQTQPHAGSHAMMMAVALKLLCALFHSSLVMNSSISLSISLSPFLSFLFRFHVEKINVCSSKIS